ncbi:MAG: cellulose binding domain-containing protein [Saccharospirillaceae bacterium]|nr:cellulose binding domain-containing protein [Saccharospirillaceae bacterium]
MFKKNDIGCLKKTIIFLVALSCSSIALAAQPVCNLEVVNNWGAGSQSSLVVTNDTNQAMSDWHIEIKFEGSSFVNNSWSTIRTGENPIKFDSLAWNKTLNPNSSFAFGFNSSHPDGFEKAIITACYTGDGPVQDDDNDGVNNDIDMCPNTTASEIVDSFGCPLLPVDDDLDSVPNTEDMCLVTPFGESVDVNGCSDSQLDDDLDSVLNANDMCPLTPFGESVDINGCADSQLDDDLDSVLNANDMCPATPNGESVDINGCAASQLDDDLDSILNPIDICTATPIGEIPDINGCSNSQLDDDFDFVLNFNDLCPETKIGETVDVNGCAHSQLDDDLDSVLNPFDMCPETPLGDLVDDMGCTIVDNTTALTSVIINDQFVLQQANISLVDVFTNLADGSTDPVELFQQFWDSQRSVPVINTDLFCQGETNGFPILCDRFETQVALMEAQQALSEMGFYKLTAVVNRIHLRKNNWEDCGEHRLVFATKNHPSFGRKFLIFEARIENPIPNDINGCADVINFWDTLSTSDSLLQASLIREFFIDNSIGLPVIAPERFLAETGQIRSNQFLGGDWLLKEHKIIDFCSEDICKFQIETVTVKENPFGELFNPELPFQGSEISLIAADFQNDFVENIDHLAGESILNIKTATDDKFNHGQSLSSGFLTFENDFKGHFANGEDSVFGQNMMNALEGKFNADGSALTVDQILARSTALTCAGCHNPDAFGLTIPGSIGALKLSDGRIIDSWPRSLMFVHIDENGALSDALINVFLPERQADFGSILNELNL